MPKSRYLVGASSAGTMKKCLFCDYEVASKTGIRLHQKYSHGIENPKTSEEKCKCCYACKKEFQDTKAFTKHMKKEHY